MLHSAGHGVQQNEQQPVVDAGAAAAAGDHDYGPDHQMDDGGMFGDGGADGDVGDGYADADVDNGGGVDEEADYNVTEQE
jgi:hypothetical protein